MNSAASSSSRKWLISLLLASLTLALYWPVHRFAFINYDDPDFVTRNDHLQHGFTVNALLWAIREPLVGNWHPVTSLALLIEYQFFGNQPAGYHWVNLLLHALNAVLLFHALQRLTGRTWPGVVVAALFSIHPLQVETVAWVSEQKSLLSACFGFLCLGAYAHYQNAPHSKVARRSYCLMISFFTLGLMSKPILVTWPFVLLLLDFWPLQRLLPGQPDFFKKLRPLLLEKTPLFVLSLFAAGFTMRAHKSAGDVYDLGQFTLAQRFDNILVSYVRYLAKTIWPHPLAIPYPLVNSWPVWQVVGAAVLLVLITVGVFWQIRCRPFLAVGWFWFLGIMVPVIGIVQEGSQSMADRHAYLPVIGLFVVVVWTAGELISSVRAARFAAAALSLVAIGTLTVVTNTQLSYWPDSLTLFGHTLAATGQNPLAQVKLGEALITVGRVDEGCSYLRLALQQYPTLVQIRAELAQALDQQGKTGGAIAEYNLILQANPDYMEALNNLAWILSTDPDPARRDGARAIHLAEHACQITGHNQTLCLGTLAAAYAQAGRFDDAIGAAQQACDLAAKQGDTNLLQRNQALLERYRRHQTAADN